MKINRSDAIFLTVSIVFFAIIFLYTCQFAYDSTIVSLVGDDKSYLVGSYHLSKLENFSDEQKWQYFYFHIHKPLIIAITAGLHWLDLSYFWFMIPFIFYILGGVFLFLFLKDKIQSRIVLFGSILILLFNSVWLYFGMHLLPDIPLATSLLAMVYFLDKSIKASGEFSVKYWYMTALLCAIATLFRLEVLPVFLVPLAYYAYIRYEGKSGTGFLKEVAADRNVLNFIIVFSVAIGLFFGVYIYLIERTTNLWDYPGIVLGQILKVKDVTVSIGVNKGNYAWIPYKTLISFTILPFILSIFGLCLLVKKREKVLYPSAVLFTGLLIESSLLTFLYHGEQRYVTRVFPFLVVFLAYFVDNLLKIRILKNNPLRIVFSIFLMGLVLYSSFFLVHKGLGESDIRYGYDKDMLTIVGSGTVALNWDKDQASVDGYFFIREAMREYDGTYERIFTNVDPASYSEYIRIIDKKEIYQINETSAKQLNASSDIIILLSSGGELQKPHVKHMYFKPNMFFPSGVHVYISKP